MTKKSIKEDLKIMVTGLKEVHKLNTKVIPITILDSLFKSIFPFINFYMSARIIDELLGHKNIDRLIFLVALTIGLNFLVHLISKGLGHMQLFYRRITWGNQEMALNEKIIHMDYEHIENPHAHELRTRIAEAENFNGGGIILLVSALGDITRSIITIIVSIILVLGLFKLGTINLEYLNFINSKLITFGFIGFIITSTIINLNLRSTFDKQYFRIFSKVMDTNRIFSYYFDILHDYNAGKSIRLYNQGQIFNEELDMVLDGVSNIHTEIGSMGAKVRGLSGLVSSLAGGMVYLYVAIKAIIGAISIGSIVQYAGSINQFISGSTDFLSSWNSLRNNNQYLQLYIDFLNIEGEKYKGTLPIEKRNDDEYEIEFKNVSFKYPGTDQYVLKNISMKLNIGERLAIVGMNGSGKTTFIKLLSRLYDPNGGEILLNGINIKKYDYDEYLNLFSIVFQDFKLFSFSLGQNVAASVDYDEDLVIDSLEKAGLKERLSTMSKGIETPLYKDFDEDGVEISGGEAQKIALARTLYRDAPIIILDEPTAALDPIAEFEIYSKFNQLVGTKTAFYISHRLSSCRFCDEIAVFHEGEIIQKGHHDELLEERDGKYHELWHSQAQYYNEEMGA